MADATTATCGIESLPEELLQLILSMVPLDPTLVSAHLQCRCWNVSGWFSRRMLHNFCIHSAPVQNSELEGLLYAGAKASPALSPFRNRFRTLGSLKNRRCVVQDILWPRP